jgi:hypothetical protein
MTCNQTSCLPDIESFVQGVTPDPSVAVGVYHFLFSSHLCTLCGCMVDRTMIKLRYTYGRRFLGLHPPFPVKAFNICTQNKDWSGLRVRKKNSCHAYNIWNTRHVRCCCRITHTTQTIQNVDWWYKNVEKIFRKKKFCKYILYIAMAWSPL